jgi:hypothetical protein
LAKQISKVTDEVEVAQSWLGEVKKAVGDDNQVSFNMDFTISVTTPSLDVSDAQTQINSANDTLAKFEKKDGNISLTATIDKALEKAGDKYDSSIANFADLKPEALTKHIAIEIQSKLDNMADDTKPEEYNAQYAALKALLPLTNDAGTGTLDLKNISISNLNALLEASGISLNSFDTNGTAASALKKVGSALPSADVVSIKLYSDGKSNAATCTLTLSDLATALQGKDLDTIYKSIVNLLSDEEKELTLSKLVDNELPIEFTITKGTKTYPITVYLSVEFQTASSED